MPPWSPTTPSGWTRRTTHSLDPLNHAPTHPPTPPLLHRPRHSSQLPHGVEVPGAARPLDDALTQSVVYTQPPEPPQVEEPAPMEEEEEGAGAEGEADGEPADGAEAAAEES